MSILLSESEGWVVSHQKFLELSYASANLMPKGEMFLIKTPYRKDAEAEKLGLHMTTSDAASDPKKLKLSAFAKRDDPPLIQELEEKKEVNFVVKGFNLLISGALKSGHFNFFPTCEDVIENNYLARKFSDDVFKLSRLTGELESLLGKNDTDKAIVRKIHGNNYIVPKNSSYFCGDIFQIDSDFLKLKDFNLAVIDPPWWNKYIRRRKSAKRSSSYNMLSNTDLSNIPLGSLLAPGALVAIWCTNSPSNIKDLKEVIMPSWGLSYLATWYWVKVDLSGSPICKFSKPPGKQPFERILFGRTSFGEQVAEFKNPEDGKIILSVPSAIHSHKPPLYDLLVPLVNNQEPKILELFARSLMPNTTSCGFEVLKLQHDFLFQDIKSK